MTVIEFPARKTLCSLYGGTLFLALPGRTVAAVESFSAITGTPPATYYRALAHRIEEREVTRARRR